MERALWTDERIDDMVDRVEKRFDQVDHRLDRIEDQLVTLRRDMHIGFMAQTTALLTLAGVVIAHAL